MDVSTVHRSCTVKHEHEAQTEAFISSSNSDFYVASTGTDTPIRNDLTMKMVVYHHDYINFHDADLGVFIHIT